MWVDKYEVSTKSLDRADQLACVTHNHWFTCYISTGTYWHGNMIKPSPERFHKVITGMKYLTLSKLGQCVCELAA